MPYTHIHWPHRELPHFFRSSGRLIQHMGKPKMSKTFQHQHQAVYANQKQFIFLYFVAVFNLKRSQFICFMPLWESCLHSVKFTFNKVYFVFDWFQISDCIFSRFEFYLMNWLDMDMDMHVKGNGISTQKVLALFIYPHSSHGGLHRSSWRLHKQNTWIFKCVQTQNQNLIIIQMTRSNVSYAWQILVLFNSVEINSDHRWPLVFMKWIWHRPLIVNQRRQRLPNVHFVCLFFFWSWIFHLFQFQFLCATTVHVTSTWNSFWK